MKRLIWLLPLFCVLLCSCNALEEDNPSWLYVDHRSPHTLNRFVCTVQEGKLTEAEYVFRHPDPSKPFPAGMAAAWTLGNEAPVCTDIAQMEGNNTRYKVDHLPLLLRFLEHLPETPPEDCRISIWMPEEEELQELLAENDYLIGRVGAGEVRTPEPGEVPGLRLADKGNVLFGALLVEDTDGQVVSLVLLEGTVS
ncbi:MAG: hypothetical protein IJA84_07260 [Clostridia bacterium]|nr:hypothetical protein [Clostridia bacterium]